MGIRDQVVELGYGITKLRRAVYDIRDNKDLNFQTGFVLYDSTQVPVWRPYDPADLSHEAKWRKGRWFNIYDISMLTNPQARHLNYLSQQISVGKKTAQLPRVELEYMYQFRNFLKDAAESQKKR